MPPGKALSSRKTELDQEHGKSGFVTRILWCDDDDCQTTAVRFQIVYDDDEPDFSYPVLANVENLHFEAGGPEQVAILRDALVNLGYPPHEPTTLIIPRIHLNTMPSITLIGLSTFLAHCEKYGPDRRIPTRADLLHADVEMILGTSVDRTLERYYLTEYETLALEDGILSYVYDADPRNLAFPNIAGTVNPIHRLPDDILYSYGRHYVRDLLAELRRRCPDDPPPTVQTYYWERNDGYMVGMVPELELIIEFLECNVQISGSSDSVFEVERGSYVPKNGAAPLTIHPVYL